MPTEAAKPTQGPVRPPQSTRARNRSYTPTKGSNGDSRQSSRVYFSEVLGQRYEIRENGIAFEDGTGYSRREVSYLREASPALLRRVHDVKTVFEGEVVA